MGRLTSVAEKLSAAQAWHLVHTGKATIVDLREPSEFARVHVQSAINLPYSEKGLVDRITVLLHPRSPIILLSEASWQVEEAILQLQQSVFPILGVAEGNMDAWQDHGVPMEVMAQVSVHQLADAVSDGKAVVLDVREPIEWETGHVPAALLISLGTLLNRVHELPVETGVIVICESGIRSSSAASMLQAAGFNSVTNVPEGTRGYRNARLPLDFTEVT